VTEVPRVTLADIEAAAKLLQGVAIRTPMEDSRWLSSLAGGPVLLKCENLQRTGSFKIRGAYLRISQLSEAERANGVVAASAGNHAQGVALAAQLLGIKSTVFMPEGAPIPKEKATRAYGADVVFEPGHLEHALTAATAFAEETGAVLIHPFDHVDIVAGQGTAGLEILEQAPEVQTLLVPTGGGGLLAGIAIAVKATRPDVRVIGVQAEGAAAYPASLESGAPVRLDSMKTMADGIAVGLPGEITFAAVREYVDDIVTVSEESMSRALLALVERAKMIVEPAGAAAVAALLDDPTAYSTPAVAVLSGGNIDTPLLMQVIRFGLTNAGRYLVIRTRLVDRPGELMHLLQVISDAHVNILLVSHHRESVDVAVAETGIELILETRDETHAHEIVELVRRNGYPVTRMR
jgi:threonine dehydratase